MRGQLYVGIWLCLLLLLDIIRYAPSAEIYFHRFLWCVSGVVKNKSR